MKRLDCTGVKSRIGIVVCMAWVAGASAFGTEILLKDGRVLKGKLGETNSLVSTPGATVPGNTKTIIFLDNDLTRTFVSRKQIQEAHADPAGQIEETFQVKHPYPKGASKVMDVGSPAGVVKEFDEFGRRIFPMRTAGGKLDVIQAITQITPQWTKVEGLNYIWDERIATSTIPHDVLQKILMHQIDPTNVDQRIRIARLYIQMERYDEARQELARIVADFPAQTDLPQRLDPQIRGLLQLEAKQLLDELKLRRAAGQHKKVLKFLKSFTEKFPPNEVAGETLQAVREIISQYDALEVVRIQVQRDCLKMAMEINKPEVGLIQREIADNLTIDLLPRMAAYRQNLNEPTETKMALAMSGWMLGADAATVDLSTAISAVHLRETADQYLSEPLKLHRDRIFQKIPSQAAATPEILSALLSHMKPPGDLPDLLDPNIEGYYKLDVPVMPTEPSVEYFVQLPPEYDPYRRYPVIVSLHALQVTPELQIDWWAGAVNGKERHGHAAQHGYIVVAPEWATKTQREYEYTSREHAAVLSCVRDVCRRFAVDTDRIFLTGHSAGGDAAWDIGLSHPDLWAGVLPIAAEPKQVCALYWSNARDLPFYVVEGELDGGRMTRAAGDLDRYLIHGYNTTVVEYLGRGHDHFIDEQIHLFDWMNRFHRNFAPREFACETMRQWDRYFWWAEVDGLPQNAQYDSGWPPPRGYRPITINGRSDNNNISLKAGTARATIWLSPESIDFKRRVNLTVNGHQIVGLGPTIHPRIETLLEDVRTRGDRQHPFWAKIDVP